jgi:hypothetical protein
MSLNFNALIERVGEITAMNYLAEIERAAHLKPQYCNPDPEARLAHAIRLQDALADECATATTRRFAAQGNYR